MKYRGNCAYCNAGRKHGRMVATLRSKKGTRPVPSGLSIDLLPHYNSINCRLCTHCYEYMPSVIAANCMSQLSTIGASPSNSSLTPPTTPLTRSSTSAFSTPPSTPISASTRSILGDLTNRKYSTPISKKEKIVQDVRMAESSDERREVLQRISKKTVKRYEEVLQRRDSIEKKNRGSKRRRRLKGGGRKTVLSDEQEEEIEKYIIDLRGPPDHCKVTERLVQGYVREKYKVKASNKWMQGFMKRRGFSIRLRTTCKKLSSEEMQSLADQFRVDVESVFKENVHTVIWNMDETPYYLDAPGNRTIEKINTKTVEIGTTAHEKSRISVLLCASCSGNKMSALVIHRSTSTKKRNTVNLKHINDIPLWVSYNDTAYNNHDMMMKWLEQIYVPNSGAMKDDTDAIGYNKTILFMDNFSGHDRDELLESYKKYNVNMKCFAPLLFV